MRCKLHAWYVLHTATVVYYNAFKSSQVSHTDLILTADYTNFQHKLYLNLLQANGKHMLTHIPHTYIHTHTYIHEHTLHAQACKYNTLTFNRNPPSDRQPGVPASHTGTATTAIIISMVPARRTAGSHCTSWKDSSQQSWFASIAVCMGEADTQEVLHMENHHQDTKGAGCCTPG